ncbi:MAG: hypothetical protein R2748_02330 [Bryobacterales bacterium]
MERAARAVQPDRGAGAGGSRFPYTFYAGYTNGWLGYLLTADEWQYGGYEPSVSPYTPEAQFDLERAVGAALDALPR